MNRTDRLSGERDRVAEVRDELRRRIDEVKAELAARIADARTELVERVSDAGADVAEQTASVLELEVLGNLPWLHRKRTRDWRAELAEARRDLWRATMIVSAYNWAAIVLLLVYAKLVFGIDFLLQNAHVVVPLIGVGVVGGILAGLSPMRPLVRFFRRTRGVDQEAEVRSRIDTELLRAALNFPLWRGLIDFAAWALIGTALSITVMALSPEEAPRIFRHMLLGSLFTGEVVGLFVFYHTESILGRTLLPFLMEGRAVSSIDGVVPVPTYVRILLLLFSTSVGPLSFLLIVSLYEEPSNQVLLFVILGVIALGLWQVRYILSSISGPIGRVAGMFERLRRGEEVAEGTRVIRTDALGRLAEMFDDLLRTIRERDLIRTTFGRYVDPRVAEAILEGRIPFGGSRVEATVSFSDIRDFSSLAESMPPEEVVEFLNDYLERMVAVVTRHDGTAHKFIGDGFLAVWGVPLVVDRHRQRAVEAALEMFRVLGEINEIRAGRGRRRIEVGVAVHSGEVIAGNVGSAEKMEFGVIGPTVNTCAKLEDTNRGLGSVLTITPEVYEGLSDDLRRRFDRIDEVELRGKNGIVRVYRYFPDRS